MAKIRKRGGGDYVSPLLMGLRGLVVSMGILALGTFNLGGYFVADGQREVLKLKEDGTPLPFLQAAEVAAKNGDYLLAEELTQQSPILGASDTLEDLIWPERVVEEEIAKLEETAKESESAAIYLRLAVAYWRLKEQEKAREMLDKAVGIDPNNEEVGEIKEKLFF